MSSGICSVQANPTIFLQDDPCPDTPKYLEVQYNCIKTQKSKIYLIAVVIIDRFYFITVSLFLHRNNLFL